MIRLFVGLEPPAGVTERLAALSAGIPNARWVAPENMHVTLRFVGNVDEALAAELDAALAELKAPEFAFELAGFDTFSRGRDAHTLWAGVEKAPPLAHLRHKVEATAVRLGLPPEPRRFSPHVTVARLKAAPEAPLQDFLVRNALFRAGPVPCPHFTLFSSHLGRSGASYAAEARYPLHSP